MPDPGPDRVAAVVARVERMAGPRGTYPKRVLPYLVEALDAAGLLLTEERRKRLRDHLSVLRPVLLEARLPKTCEMHDALLRELAGDGGSGVEVPTVITTARDVEAARAYIAVRDVWQPDAMTEGDVFRALPDQAQREADAETRLRTALDALAAPERGDG